jgi:hypothetical protein
VEQRKRLLDLVPADRELGRPTQPHPGSLAQPVELLLITPGEVCILRSDRLRVVMSEQRCVLVPTLSRSREPVREARMENGPPRTRKAAICDLARKRVFDHELSLTVQ